MRLDRRAIAIGRMAIESHGDRDIGIGQRTPRADIPRRVPCVFGFYGMGKSRFAIICIPALSGTFVARSKISRTPQSPLLLFLGLFGARFLHDLADLVDGPLELIEHRRQLRTVDINAIDAEALEAFDNLRILGGSLESLA